MQGKQYCRYCSHCTCGDIPYCMLYGKIMSESTIRHSNKCKGFVLSETGDVETGQSYKPRQPSKEAPPDDNQISFSELENNLRKD